jgi:hypothetical protein
MAGGQQVVEVLDHGSWVDAIICDDCDLTRQLVREVRYGNRMGFRARQSYNGALQLGSHKVCVFFVNSQDWRIVNLDTVRPTSHGGGKEMCLLPRINRLDHLRRTLEDLYARCKSSCNLGSPSFLGRRCATPPPPTHARAHTPPTSRSMTDVRVRPFSAPCARTHVHACTIHTRARTPARVAHSPFHGHTQRPSGL